MSDPEIKRYGKRAALLWLRYSAEDLNPSMHTAAVAVSPYESGTEGAAQVMQAAFEYLRSLPGAARAAEDLKARLVVARGVIGQQVSRGHLAASAQRITDLRVKDWRKV